MAEIQIPNVRQESTVLLPTRLKDNGVTVNWSSLANIKAYMYSDVQRVIAGKCSVEVDGEDSAVLNVTYPATRPQYLGVNSLLIRCTYQGRQKTFDLPVVNFVERTAEATGVTVLDDPEMDVTLEVDEVSTSLLDGAIAAALDAAVKAEEAAALVPLQVLEDCVEVTENAETATAAANEAAAAANAAGITSVQASVDDNEPGTPSVDATLLNKVLTLVFHHLKGLKGDTGVTPNISVGTVSTGAPGSSVVVTITGTAEAPVLNLTIPQGAKGDKGDQGNTGSSVDYPFELVNNLTTDDATKALSAAQGVVLEGEISQLGQKATKGFDKTELTPTAITKLNIDVPTLTFKSTTSGSVRLYYVPCNKGDTFLVTASAATEATFKYGFSSAIPEASGALISAEGYTLSSAYFMLTAPANGYLSVYCNATTFPNVKIYSTEYTDLYKEVVKNAQDISSNKASADAGIEGAMEALLGRVLIVGAGTTMVTSAAITDIIVGHKYRFYLKNWPFGQGGSYRVFEAVAVDGSDNETILVFERGDATAIKDYYEATIPSGTVSLKIKGRVAASNTGECYMQDVTPMFNKLTHLNICLLGNSYTADAWRYVPTMLLAYGITCKIDFYYRGSLSLWDLDDQWTSDSATDPSKEDGGGSHSRYYYYCDSRLYGGKWFVGTRKSAYDVVRLDRWDIVEIQQRGDYNKDLADYYPYLQNVIDKIMAGCPYPFALWWFSAYDSAADNAIEGNTQDSLDAQEKIYKAYPFDHILPVGSTIFGGQLDTDFAAIGDSSYGHLYGSDDKHLQEGLPCYLASCAIVQAILDKYAPGKSVLGDLFRATDENIADLGLDQTLQGDSTGVTDANCAKAQKEALIASRSPFDIQPPIAGDLS